MTQPAPSVHPSQQLLAAFVRGALSDAEDQEVETHVAQCSECSQTLSALSDDTIVGLLRQEDPAALQETLPPREEATQPAEAASKPVLDVPAELADHPRYQLQKLLGQGGMGSVYKAQHRLMNRPVALKVINQQLVQNEAAVRRFHREVQAAARLAHPNIVTAYDAEQAGDVHFLVMEYVDGIDLAELVRRRGPLPVAEACDYIRQAALGLQHAHEHGMVHRDIKPQNLMVVGVRSAECGVRSETVARAGSAHSAFRTPHSALLKILDFGLAGFVSEVAAELVEEQMSQTGERTPTHLTQIGAMMGTPDYISPEQARDAHSADIRSDIYSLGCTMYYILTGQPPHRGDSVLEKVMAHVEREPKPLADFRSDIPRGLEEVLRQMLAKDPSQRYQTPAELAAALGPFVVPPSGGTSRLKPGLQRPLSKRAIAVAATLLAGFLAVMAGVVVVATDRGVLHIQSEVGDVEIRVTSNIDGQEVATIDAQTGSQIRWLRTGDYQVSLVGQDNAIKLDKSGFRMTRLGRVIVTARWNSEAATVFYAAKPSDQPITQDGVTPEEGGWKITATGDRTVRLFEAAPPQPPQGKLAKGPFFYRAKLRTQDVKGRAYLEMWVRFPGMGEFFSKGFDKALSGTNGWAEYEIPFYLQDDQLPDLVKLNVAIEGAGTVWIKDIQLRGRVLALPEAPMDLLDYDRLQGRWVAVSVKAGNGAIPPAAVPQWTMTFTGRNVRVTTPTNSDEGTYTLDPSKLPKEIDVAPAGGQGRLRGIYRFVDKELEVCMDDSNRKRPIQWDVDVGTRQLLVRLRRSQTPPAPETTALPQTSRPAAVSKP